MTFADRFAGKTLVVTGAAQGIGRAVALRAAADPQERLNPGVEAGYQPRLPPVGRRRARGSGGTLKA